MTRMIALLRAVNVGNRRLPMAGLRDLAAELGFTEARTYVASGNLVFAAAGHDPSVAAARIEAAITRRYGFKSEVVLRTAAQWAKYAEGSPFPEAEKERSRALHLVVSVKPPAADAVERLQARASVNERIAVKGGAVWIDFAGGLAQSKLTTALLDKCIGSPATARNWNTVLTLHEMATG